MEQPQASRGAAFRSTTAVRFPSLPASTGLVSTEITCPACKVHGADYIQDPTVRAWSCAGCGCLGNAETQQAFARRDERIFDLATGWMFEAANLDAQRLFVEALGPLLRGGASPEALIQALDIATQLRPRPRGADQWLPFLEQCSDTKGRDR